ncbi:MAG: tRNA pseudouridine(55) synthase TruB [Firmicutes bacterium GWE2_51_13]|nr:MAG: tRNA pseudouridine(55) synthase TruB [Firmicutes bacterium GWE2_51_13]
MDGVCLINKPKGYTSFDVVNKLRRILGERRIGHTGTLDPQAEGVLVVLLGKATKAMPFLVSHRKEYVAKLKLGVKTDTGDVWGETIETMEMEMPDKERVDAVLRSFIGEYSQIPPMVSAIRVDGKRLYEYARQNKTIERKAREIQIHEIELISIEDEIEFRVVCSSGTYIRTLCEDIAERFGGIGTMSKLTRTKVQEYTLESCQELSTLTLETVRLQSLASVLSHMPKIDIDDPTFVYHGKPLKLDMIEEEVLLMYRDEALAVYKKAENGEYRSLRGLW